MAFSYYGNNDKVHCIYKLFDFFGTLLGMTPQIFVWATLGNGIEKIIYKNIQVPSFKDLILSPEIYLPIIGFIVILILGLLTKKKFFKD